MVIIQVDNLGLKKGYAMVLKQTLDAQHSQEGNSKKFSLSLGFDSDYLGNFVPFFIALYAHDLAVVTLAGLNERAASSTATYVHERIMDWVLTSSQFQTSGD